MSPTPTFSPTRTLVTGASSGLGAEFARRVAARGSDLVLVARRRDRLDALADELRAAHGVTVEVVTADLAEPGAAERVRGAVDGEVDALFNGAGFGGFGPFLDAEPSAIRNELQVDVVTLVELTRAFLPAMAEAGRGTVVNVASTAAFQPTPGMAVYGGAKTFVLSFSSALWQELRGRGITVLALCPGPTRTEFFDVAGGTFAMGGEQTTEAVLDALLRALDRRDPGPATISGARNKVLAFGTRFAPRRLAVVMAERMLGLLPR